MDLARRPIQNNIAARYALEEDFSSSSSSLNINYSGLQLSCIALIVNRYTIIPNREYALSSRRVVFRLLDHDIRSSGENSEREYP